MRSGNAVESKGVSEILAGTIRGQSGQSPCIVSALRLTERASKEVSYTNYRIRDVVENLEDGSYQLTVNGETLRLELVQGEWSIEGRPAHPENQ
jgi:hypothetical protein